jgi:hypothetical protein
MLIVVIMVLLALWLVLSIIGFVIKGLMWLALLGIILFVITAVVGYVRRSGGRKTHV